MNTELANKVLAQIEAHPEQHDQGSWRCDTTMCFAGWTTFIAGDKWLVTKFNEDEGLDDYVIVPDGSYGAQKLRRLLGNSWTGFKHQNEHHSAFNELAQAWHDDVSIAYVARRARELLQLNSFEAGELFFSACSLEDVKCALDKIQAGEV